MPLKKRRSTLDSNKLITVTGSTGFLGKHLVSSIRSKGENVFEISRKNGFDIRSYESLGRVPRFDIMIHLAARVYVPDSFTDSRAFY